MRHAAVPRITRIKAMGLVDYPPGSGYGPRVMRDHELVWFISGAVTYVRDGVRYAAPAGSVVYCRPNAVDAFEWDRQRTTRHAYFHFDVTPAPPPDTPVVTRLSDGDVIDPLFRFILRMGTDTRDPLALHAAATLLMAISRGQTQTHEVGLPVLPALVEQTLLHIWQMLERDPRRRVNLHRTGALGRRERRAFVPAVQESHQRDTHAGGADGQA